MATDSDADSESAVAEPANLFELLADLLGMQRSNATCQLEHAQGLLCSRLTHSLSRSANRLSAKAAAAPRGPVPETNSNLLKSWEIELLKMRDELLLNYIKWSRMLDVDEVDFKRALGDGCGSESQVAALEVALFLLIWGEVGNARFCSEFVAWLYHKLGHGIIESAQGCGHDWASVYKAYMDPSKHLAAGTFRKDIMVPVCALLASQHEAVKEGKPHSSCQQHDDFNETFWSDQCLSWDPYTVFAPQRNRQGGQADIGSSTYAQEYLRKTFVERQSWAHVFHSFWRVYIMLLTVLHLLIMANLCQQQTPTKDDACAVRNFLSPTVTLTACLLISDAYSLFSNTAMCIFHKGSRLTVALSTVRFAWRVGLQYLLVLGFYLQDHSADVSQLWPIATAIAVITWLAPSAVLFCLTHIRSGRYRHKGLRVLELLTDCTSLRVFTTGILDRSPPWRKRAKYTLFWVVVLAVKFAFAYFAILNNLIGASVVIYGTDAGTKFLDTVPDKRNIAVLLALWVGSLGVYLIDIHFWFVLASNIVAYMVGSQRGVGKTSGTLHGDDYIIVACMSAHKHMMGYLGEYGVRSERQKLAYAKMWNAFICSMREDDMIGDNDALCLKYHALKLDAGEPVVMLPAWVLSGVIDRLQKALAGCQGTPEQRASELDCWARVKGVYQQIDGKSLVDALSKNADLHGLCNLSKFTGVIKQLRALAREVENNANAPAIRAPYERTVRHLLDAIMIKERAATHIDSEAASVGAQLRSLRNHLRQALEAAQTTTAPDDSVAEAVAAKHGMLAARLRRILADGRRPDDTRSASSSGDLSDPSDAEPSNPLQIASPEAMRRIRFFLSSLLMKRPEPTLAQFMPSWSTLTPYYNEAVLVTIETLCSTTEEKINQLEYLTCIYKNEWDAFNERMRRECGMERKEMNVVKDWFFGFTPVVIEANKDAEKHKRPRQDAVLQLVVARGGLTNIEGKRLQAARRAWSRAGNQERLPAEHEVQLKCYVDEMVWQVQLWASYRAQTLARTVRGYMHQHTAVRIMHTVEQEALAPEAPDALHNPVEIQTADIVQQARATSDVTDYCPLVDEGGRTWAESRVLADAKYRYVVSCQILPAMRLKKAKEAVYIDWLAQNHPGLCIAYVLEVKEDTGGEKTHEHYSVLARWSGDSLKEEHRIQLPGTILVGEGKPNNQNQAMVFTRGDAVQAIDMNQDLGLEEAFKQREMLANFRFGGHARGERAHNAGLIVGFREHIFTHAASAVAMYFSLQESGFVTATQRVLDDPLGIRFHYGHPDLFDKITAITQGGNSRPSTKLHLSEDILAGYVWVLRGGDSIQLDFIQAGKAILREPRRIVAQLGFLRLLSFYYSCIGGFLTQTFLIFSVFVYMYSKLFLAFEPHVKDIIDTINKNPDQNLDEIKSVFTVLNSAYFLQLARFVVVLESGVKGLVAAAGHMVKCISPLYFIFNSATIARSVNEAITQNKAVYMPTGRGFVIEHGNFISMFKGYYQSHFMLAAELVVLIALYFRFSFFPSPASETFSVIILAAGLLYAPILYNPFSLSLKNTVRDFREWGLWMLRDVTPLEKDVEEKRKKDPKYKVEVTLLHMRRMYIAWGLVKKISSAVNEGGDANDAHTAASDPGTLFLYVLLAAAGTVLAVGIFEAVVARRQVAKPRPIPLASEDPVRREVISGRSSIAVGSSLPNEDSAEETDNWRFNVHRVGRLIAVVAVMIIAFLVVGAADDGINWEQALWLFVAYVYLLFFVVLFLLVWFHAASEWPPVEGTMRLVCLTTGILVQLPALVLSLLGLYRDAISRLQTAMLFNPKVSKLIKKGQEREHKKQRDTSWTDRGAPAPSA
ncbi:1,3-beta-glucan synthase component-domain-containing protein [Tribonema minus]|uniref:1,3-beta-glucan synthase n=1 Tax=Tribonema minus TaxID=303371 RepID=A0A836C8X3_9STRA|nr:1,3-beta-glucan synthase component-domain-containing protein [Tribonema minus]